MTGRALLQENARYGNLELLAADLMPTDAPTRVSQRRANPRVH